MSIPEIYSSNQHGGKEPDLEPDMGYDEDYDHINRSSDNAMGYFIKFLLVISIVTFSYLYLTGKL